MTAAHLSQPPRRSHPQAGGVTQLEARPLTVEALPITAANVLFSSPAVHPSRDVNNLLDSLADPTNPSQNRYVVDITLDVGNVILDIGTVRHLTSLSFFTTGLLDLGGLFPRNFRLYSGITGSGPWVLAGQSFRTEPTPTAPVETSVSEPCLRVTSRWSTKRPTTLRPTA
jgi:hypothetical protein